MKLSVVIDEIMEEIVQGNVAMSNSRQSENIQAAPAKGYEFFIAKDGLVHINIDGKEASSPKTMEDFKKWLISVHKAKDEATASAIIKQLNANGLFAENNPPVDMQISNK